MKKYFPLTVFLLLCCSILAQNNAQKIEDLNVKTEELKKSIEEGKRKSDSILQAINESQNKRMEEQNKEQMERFNEQNKNQLDSWSKRMEEENKRKTRSNWIRGIGLLVVVVFSIVGYMKKKSKT